MKQLPWVVNAMNADEGHTYEDLLDRCLHDFLNGDLLGAARSAKMLAAALPHQFDVRMIGRAAVMSPEQVEEEQRQASAKFGRGLSASQRNCYAALLEFRSLNSKRRDDAFFAIAAHFPTSSSVLEFASRRLAEKPSARTDEALNAHLQFAGHVRRGEFLFSVEPEITPAGRIGVSEERASTLLAVEREREFGTRTMNDLVWRMHEAHAHRHFLANNPEWRPSAETRSLHELGYVSGALSEPVQLLAQRIFEHVDKREKSEFFAPTPHLVSELFAELVPMLESIIGTRIQLYNCVAKLVSPASPHNSFNWHKDGFPGPIRKLILYLDSPFDYGGTEIIDQTGKVVRHLDKNPCWTIFCNGPLYHRGVLPKDGFRRTIEMTLLPAFSSGLANDMIVDPEGPPYPEYFKAFADEWASYPGWETSRSMVERLSALVGKMRAECFFARRVQNTHASNAVSPPRNLNIGGGRHFVASGWINLEAEVSPENPTRFLFHPDVSFPVKSGTIERVYSSHCFEHLDTATFDRVMSETKRVLTPGGRLVFKIPDYDRILQLWTEGAEAAFDADFGVPEDVMANWERFGIARSFASKVIYWIVSISIPKSKTGHQLFDGSIAYGDSDFRLPVRVSDEEASKILSGTSPSAIAKELRQRSEQVKFEESYYLHRSAWSRKELCDILRHKGFENISFETDAIIQQNRDIRYIHRSPHTQLYCACVNAA